MDRPDRCPRCLSKFADIKGVIYPNGNANDGFQCDDPWHLGVGYDPNILVLTEEDRAFLKEMLVAL